MAGFLNKLRSASATNTGPSGNALPKAKKDDPAPEMTPLEKMLQNAGPLREDGSDKFFGLENFGNTCYCNSIVQALYFSEPFRENVVKYPPFSPSDTPNGQPRKVNVQIRPPMANGSATSPTKQQKPVSGAQATKQKQAANGGPAPPGQQRPEDKPDSPEYKKKQAMIKGPVLELAQENSGAYGMDECTFTGLKDIFTALIESNTRTGVLSPQRFLEIFKRDNEMFRNSMHQDAHEFYGLVLNDVISNVEDNAKRLQECEEVRNQDGLAQSVEKALGASSAIVKSQASGTRTPGTGWVHDIFEGVLTSETKCLTCETTSQRDETFLDLSIDLEEHSSVTSCLRKFSAEEMLCERNKFYCDRCGGLQEAEKRMKIKKLPKVLALHLKRFKYTEDYSRLQKLFHRVVYPYHLRMFNTTDDAEDPDRLYELYAVVVHIGGNAYHGHYVSVIKTQDRGWLLFDDEMVEPVDKHFVRNFFGDKPGMACAYVLFYQETTVEKVLAEQEAEGLEEVRLASQKADIALSHDHPNGHAKTSLSRHITQPTPFMDDHDALTTLGHARTAPGLVASPTSPTPVSQPDPSYSHPLVAAPPPAPAVESTGTERAEKVEKPAKPSKEEKEREKKELKAMEKARKAAEKEHAKAEEKQRRERAERVRDARQKEAEELKKALAASKQIAAEEEAKRKKEHAAEHSSSGFLSRSKTTSKSMSRKSFGFLGKDKDSHKLEKIETNALDANQNGSTTSSSDKPDTKLKERFSFSLGKKKSNNLLQ
ncbi:Cysteine proteinase [Pleurostoma richardsiae]|uniref:Ubiquitin carboxyl-terminal hydrolase n=1 Tax=Pleurostoma richardsiae TaxID=41990 RepID=A0AA38RW27_9PEZI|nr:Cysteine proteinase [Pleurostoma richardsiae]